MGYFELMRAGHTRIRAEGWNHHIERQITQRWPPVCRAWFPEGSDLSLDWTWKFFQYVFPLGDPRNFSALGDREWSQAEVTVLDRYLSHARDLAQASALTATSGYSVHMATPQAEPEVVENVSPRDATVGFLTMFRQCYAPDEPASFKRAYDLVARETHRQERDGEPLKTWRRAHADLRRTHLDHLILVQAATDGHVPQHLAERNASHPSELDSPQQMLSALFYGDSIHWGDQRPVIEAWNRHHPAIAVKRRFDALRAAIHLGHLYVGFAAVVGMATGGLSPGER